LGDRERAKKVGLNDSLYGFDVGSTWRTVSREISDPGVIDQDIEPLKLAADEAGCFLNGFPPAKVKLNELCLEALVPELGGGIFAQGWVARSKENVAAGLAELPGDLESDSFISAGNQCDFL